MPRRTGSIAALLCVVATLGPPPVLGGSDDPDRRIAEEIARLMAADTDHDGRISWAAERDGWTKREAARARRLDVEKQRGR